MGTGLKCIIPGKIEGNGRQGRSRKQLLDDLKKGRIFWKLKEEAQDLSLWRTRFSRFCGPAIRQTIDYYYYYCCCYYLLLHVIKFYAAAILNITLTTSGI
jgi:hypothetical protein